MSAQCLICLNVYSETSDIRIAECGHVFHYDCATSWLSESGDCPQCRRPLYQEQLYRVFLSFTHEFEDEALRIELQATNVVVSMLKQDLISLKSVADTAEAYKSKYDMMTKDVKIIQLELELAQMKYNDSQTQLAELKMKCFGLDEEYDKSNDTIFSVKESLKIARSEIESLKNINASQEQSLKIINDTCYQLALSNQKPAVRAPICKGNVENVLQNNDFDENKNGTKIKNLDKVVEERRKQNYDNMKSSRNEKSCKINKPKLVKNALFNTTLNNVIKEKDRTNNDNVHKPRRYSAKHSYEYQRKQNGNI